MYNDDYIISTQDLIYLLNSSYKNKMKLIGLIMGLNYNHHINIEKIKSINIKIEKNYNSISLNMYE